MEEDLILSENHDPERLLLSQPSKEEEALYRFYKENPDLACIDLLGQDLAPFQRKIIRGVQQHSKGFSILSRGSGKTRMIALCAAISCMFNPKKRVGFLGPQFRTAKLAFGEFEAIYNESRDLQACVKRISRQTDTWLVEFHNGAFIFAVPLVADSKLSIRGLRLHEAHLDEYPHVPEEVIDLVINPMLATQRNPMANVRRIEREKKLIAQGLLKEEDRVASEKNKVWGWSSAYYQHNHMYKKICTYKELAKEQKAKSGKSDYATYIFNYLDAPEGFFDISAIEHAKRTSSEVAFKMEYMSYFPADSDGFFKRSLLDSCVSRTPNAFYLEMTGKSDGLYFMGVDPARDRDNFTICILKLVGHEMRVVKIVALNQTPFPEATQYIRKLAREFNVTMIAMDKGGGGSAVRDMLESPITAHDTKDIILEMDNEETIGKKGRRILRLVPFSSAWLAEANHEMRTSFEHRELMLPAVLESDTFIRPAEDKEAVYDQMMVDYFAMIKELESIVLSATKTGILHFDTPNPHMRKDRYTALLLAHKIAHDYLVSTFQPKELADGGVLGPGGLLNAEEADEVDWTLTRVLDDMERLKNSRHKDNFTGGALSQ